MRWHQDLGSGRRSPLGEEEDEGGRNAGAGSVELSLLSVAPFLEPAKDDSAKGIQVTAKSGESDVPVEAKLGSIPATI